MIPTSLIKYEKRRDGCFGDAYMEPKKVQEFSGRRIRAGLVKSRTVHTLSPSLMAG